MLVVLAGFFAVYIQLNTYMPPPDRVAIHYSIYTTVGPAYAQETAQLHTALLMEAFETMDMARQDRDRTLRHMLYGFILLFALVCGVGYMVLHYKIIRPFKKLKAFATHVAAGDLHSPLVMDRDNIFGAFTESFDIMRAELKKAQENEMQANKSKKELVAALVHDVNTPVASVRSALEILKITQPHPQLDAADQKLAQISTLITNLFQATMEELEAIPVAPEETSSTAVATLLHHADDEKRIPHIDIPHCIVLADPLRLQQVFDNIIKNSYKYAGTAIGVHGVIAEEFLHITVQDHGGGVPEKELPMLTRKFYRASNVGKADGYGLGLYLTKYFLEKMGGGVYIENGDTGLMVTVLLRLAWVPHRKEECFVNKKIHDQIMAQLYHTERTHDVKIILAIESGSRGWGFAAENADYDCRFIYVHKKDWYLSILDKPDFIEYPVDETFDIKGYDITRALKYIMKPQAVVYEYLSSQEIYIKNNPIITQLQSLASEFFHPVPISYNYLGLAKKTLAEITMADTAKIKKYFYVLRPLANLNFIWQHRKMPHMDYWRTLKAIDTPGEVTQHINDLATIKMAAKEHDKIQAVTPLIKYFEQEIARFDLCIQEMNQEKNRQYEKVDASFKNIVEDVWKCTC